MLKFYFRSLQNPKLIPQKVNRAGAIGIVEDATKADLSYIARLTGLTPTDLNDVFDFQEIPRWEIEDNVVLIFFRFPLPLDNQELLETQLYMLVYNKQRLFLVTHGQAKPFIELLQHSPIPTSQPTKLLISILLTASKYYSQYINQIARKVEQFRTSAKNVGSTQIDELINHEVILNEYVSALSPMQQICASLVTSKRLGWHEEDMDLLEDLTNSMSQSVNTCLVNLKKIRSLRDSYQILHTNQLNQTVKLLTSVTIILTIPTMIASLFGMNVKLPLESHPQAFLVILILAFIFVGLTARYFKRHQWL